jgi:hypothetical protein
VASLDSRTTARALTTPSGQRDAREGKPRQPLLRQQPHALGAGSYNRVGDLVSALALRRGDPRDGRRHAARGPLPSVVVTGSQPRLRGIGGRISELAILAIARKPTMGSRGRVFPLPFSAPWPVRPGILPLNGVSGIARGDPLRLFRSCAGSRRNPSDRHPIHPSLSPLTDLRSSSQVLIGLAPSIEYL